MLTSFPPAAAEPSVGPGGCAMLTERATVDDIPVLVVRPVRIEARAPLLVAYHGLGAPADPASLADLVGPIPGVVTIYPELPLTHSRMPVGGKDELVRRQAADYAGRLFLPIVAGAAGELPRLIAAARRRYGMAPGGGTAAFGFSIGGAAALHTLSVPALRIDAVAALNAPLSTGQAIATFERLSGRAHPPTAAARAAMAAYDMTSTLPARLRDGPPVDLLLLTGSDDRLYPPAELSRRIGSSGRTQRGSTIDIVELPGLAHQVPARDPRGGLSPQVPALRAALHGWLRRAFPGKLPGACGNGDG